MFNVRLAYIDQSLSHSAVTAQLLCAKCLQSSLIAAIFRGW